jgi:hypothetical protein
MIESALPDAGSSGNPNSMNNSPEIQKILFFLKKTEEAVDVQYNAHLHGVRSLGLMKEELLLARREFDAVLNGRVEPAIPKRKIDRILAILRENNAPMQLKDIVFHYKERGWHDGSKDLVNKIGGSLSHLKKKNLVWDKDGYWNLTGSDGNYYGK